MTFTDPELDRLQKRLENPPFGMDTSERLLIEKAAAAITYLRTRDPIGAVIMRERAAEHIRTLHTVTLMTPDQNAALQIAANGIDRCPTPTQAEVLAYARALVDEKARKQFPILGSNGAKIDWELVADHGEQARQNHGQTVTRLAERGGLSWCELFAVLHNKRWEKMDTNEAMIACRSLEARYLAALEPKP